MTQNEWLKLAMGLKTVYTSNNFMPDNEAIRFWYEFFQNDAYQTVKMACQAYISTEKFPPTVADIKAKIAEITMPHGVADWSHAWESVIKAVRKYGYYSPHEAIASLDNITAKCVGGVEGFRELCLSENADVQKSLFRRAYEQVHANAKKESQYSPDIRQVMQKNKLRNQGVLGDESWGRSQMQSRQKNLNQPADTFYPETTQTENARIAEDTATSRE